MHDSLLIPPAPCEPGAIPLPFIPSLPHLLKPSILRIYMHVCFYCIETMGYWKRTANPVFVFLCHITRCHVSGQCYSRRFHVDCQGLLRGCYSPYVALIGQLSFASLWGCSIEYLLRLEVKAGFSPLPGGM